MIDLLKQAVEQAAQLPEDEQQRIAALIFAEIDPEKRWEELFNDPRSEAVLEELITRAKQQKPLPFPQPRDEE